MTHSQQTIRNSTSRFPNQTRLLQNVLWAIFGVACTVATWDLLNHDRTLNFLSIKFFGQMTTFGLRIDTISTVMLLMVTLLGAVIGRYSLSYLQGDKKQDYFYRYLLCIVLSVSLFVLSSNLLMTFVMWLSTSLMLDRLLRYFPERPQAISAARKKFYISRIGDLALIAAIGMTYTVFGTFEYAELFDAANSLAEATPAASQLAFIGVLFALGAMTKSAQFPFHFWLPETMETPTPVSALMHAGVINAGGFLIIRLSPILQHADAAHLMLASVGSITAIFGALVMITQTDIKKKLAYSTISQMGMMLFACGLGAFSLALFHIVAHSFYKAYAFLSTGFLVEESKKSKFTYFRPAPIFTATIALSGLILIGLGIVYEGGSQVAYFTYGAVLWLGTAQNIRFSGQNFSQMGWIFFTQLALACGAALTLSVFLEHTLMSSLHELVPTTWGTDLRHEHQWITCLVTYFIFVAGFWLSQLLIDPNTPRLKKIYAYLWNGGYFSHRT